MTDHWLFVPLTSLIAGFIDAIAGGGGLITIPMWTLVLGPGATVVGTNKIGAFAAASMALIVYARHHKVHWRASVFYLLSIMVGSFSGSHLTKLVSPTLFSWFLLAMCPLILLVVWNKERLFAERAASEPETAKLVFAGFLVGLYDGFFGPGGGTFMLLALLWLTDMPLMTALALSKLANALSGGISLAGFALQGYVNWEWGMIGGSSILVGAFFGAHFTKRKNSAAVKPALTFVVLLLMLKVAWDLAKSA